MSWQFIFGNTIGKNITFWQGVSSHSFLWWFIAAWLPCWKLVHSLGWKLFTHSPIGWLLISRIYGKGEMFIRSQLTSILVATFSNLLNSEVVQKSTQQLNGKFNQEWLFFGRTMGNRMFFYFHITDRQEWPDPFMSCDQRLFLEILFMRKFTVTWGYVMIFSWNYSFLHNKHQVSQKLTSKVSLNEIPNSIGYLMINKSTDMNGFIP